MPNKISGDRICRVCGNPFIDHGIAGLSIGTAENPTVHIFVESADLAELMAAAVAAEHIAEALGGDFVPTGDHTGTIRKRDGTPIQNDETVTLDMPPNLELMARIESLGIAIEEAAASTDILAHDSADAARKIAEHFLAYLDVTRQVIVSADTLDRLNAWANFAVDIVERAGDRGKVSRTWIENRRPYHTPPTAADERSLYDFEP
jgi:hypothetical protein